MTLCEAIREAIADMKWEERYTNGGTFSSPAALLNDVIDHAVMKVHDLEKEYGDGWIPVSRTLPEPRETVQVTYLSCINDEPLCDGMAYLDENGNWYWDDNEESLVVSEITAWRHLGEPYRGEEFY